MRRKILAIAVALSVSAATPAVAEPIDDFMVRLNQYLSMVGGNLSYAIGAGYSDDNTGLSPLMLTSPTGEDIALGSKSYIGAIENLKGDIISAQGLQITDFSHSSGGTTATASSIILDLVLPPVGTTNPMLIAQAVKGASVFGLQVAENDVAINVDNISFFMDVAPDHGSANPSNLTYYFSIEGLLVTEAILDEFGAPEILSLIAGKKANLDIRLDWKRDLGELTPMSVEIGIDDFGDLAASIGLGGVTDEVIYELAAIAQEAAAFASPEELQQKLIPLLSKMTITEVFSGVFNEGGGDIVLAEGQRQTGTGQASLVQAGSGEIREFFEEAGMSVFGLAVSDAFVPMALDGGGLIISGYPETPISVLEAVALAATPSALAERLGLEAEYDPPLE